MSKNKNENLETMWKYLLTNRIVALVTNGQNYVFFCDYTQNIWPLRFSILTQNV